MVVPRLLAPTSVLVVGFTISFPRPSAAQDCRYSNEDSTEVHAVAEGIIAADNARDLERVLSYYAADAMLHPPNEAPVRGRANIGPRYQQLFDAYEPQIASAIDMVDVCGTLAVVSGRNTGVFQSRHDAPDRTLSDTYVMVLGKRNGRWRITRLIWHPDRN
jgi:uncharacterized protein (TIGR02246 family)